MSKINLWEILEEMKSINYRWVDLTHELSSETPHWYGFQPLRQDLLFDYLEGTEDEKLAPMRCYQYSVASQYGTHVDAPRHFHAGGRSLNEFSVDELVFPLIVIDKSKDCAANAEYTLTKEAIIEWESVYGRIPEGAFVAFRSDWYKHSNLDNPDADGNPHYPGWDVEAIRFLVEERGIGAIGHEPADTDPSYVTTKEGAYPYPAEQYILSKDRFQIEVMRNLDQLPPVGSIIVVSFPKLKDGVGYPARVFAVTPA